jgi:crossover junction endodeoxyribonuclease RusA
MGQWTIEIPAPCAWLSMNGREHWARRAKLTRLWRAAAKTHAQRARLPRLDRAAITCLVHRSDRRKADAHNRAATVKCVIDGLVDAGVLDDDADAYLSQVAIRSGAPVAHRGGQLTIIITDAEEQ